MTHEERQALIRTPITFHIYGKTTWGGVAIADTLMHRTPGTRDDPTDFPEYEEE